MTTRLKGQGPATSTAEGVAYLKREKVLLYKAKATRPKDEDDFKACAPLMEFAARTWLKNALALYIHHIDGLTISDSLRTSNLSSVASSVARLFG